MPFAPSPVRSRALGWRTGMRSALLDWGLHLHGRRHAHIMVFACAAGVAAALGMPR